VPSIPDVPGVPVAPATAPVGPSGAANTNANRVAARTKAPPAAAKAGRRLRPTDRSASGLPAPGATARRQRQSRSAVGRSEASGRMARPAIEIPHAGHPPTDRAQQRLQAWIPQASSRGQPGASQRRLGASRAPAPFAESIVCPARRRCGPGVGHRTGGLRRTRPKKSQAAARRIVTRGASPGPPRSRRPVPHAQAPDYAIHAQALCADGVDAYRTSRVRQARAGQPTP